MEATGTVGALSVAGDVTAASVALAGLILVYLGALSATFDSYQKTEKVTVRSKFQQRAWFAYIGFVLALLSSALAVVGKWLAITCAAQAAVIILLLALIWVLIAAGFVVMDIK
jgi:hypothetical protein